MLAAATPELALTTVQFHPDFFCIIKHQEELACNGVLFNNIYQLTVVGETSQARLWHRSTGRRHGSLEARAGSAP